MKRFLSIAAFTAVSAAALLPLSASAQTRVQVVVGNAYPTHAYQHHDAYRRHAPERFHRAGHAYAPAAWDARHGRYVEPRRWVDRNRDGMDDRRGRRDLDRDGIRDRYDRDLDNDGIANRRDRDIDGDGVPNRRDRRPDNYRAY